MLWSAQRRWQPSLPHNGEKGATDDQDQQAPVDPRHATLHSGRRVTNGTGGALHGAPPVFQLSLLFLLACGDAVATSGLPLTFAVVGDLAPMSPGVQATYTAVAEDLVFSHVLTPAEDGSFTSAVLSSWSRWPDGTMELELREGLSFSNGSAATVPDLVNSLAAAGLHARATSGRRVLVNSTTPLPPIEPTLLSTALFRRHGNMFLGTGAYRVNRSSSDELVLDRVRSAPHGVGRVTFRRFETPAAALAAALERRANAMLYVTPGIEEMARDTSLRLVEGRPVQAIVMFVDHRSVDSKTRDALFRVPTDRIAAALERRTPQLTPEGPSVGNGPPLRVLVPHLDLNLDRAALALRRTLLIASHPVTLEHDDWNRVHDRMLRGDYQVAIDSLLVWPPAAATAVWATGAPFNVAHYSNAGVDEALAAGDFTRAAELLRADPPVLELSPRPRRALIDSRITDARLGPYGLLQSLPDWHSE